MANTYALGGSPLGLINMKSRPVESSGQSTFNGGKSRNINVFSYNRGKSQPIGVKSGGKDVSAPASLFSGGAIPNFWPNADLKIGTEGNNEGIKDRNQASTAGSPGTGVNSKLHNDSVYDLSTLNIIEKLSFSPTCALKPQDFAYCKYLGVYPNNRLMIARRFPSTIKDNIFSKSELRPKSILISWKPEEEDFLEFSFGEEWIDADADFTNVLNKLGENFGIEGTGTGLSKALNVLPLPGFTEELQRKVLVSLGVLKASDANQPLPSGNPNIIKMAKRRKTIGYGEAGYGLRATISVKMTCEYEQKFISGIDPTVAWQDILNNIMIFGTSNSSNYGLDPQFVKNLDTWSKNPSTLVSAIVSALKDGIQTFKNGLEKAAKSAKEAFLDTKNDKNQFDIIEDAKKTLKSSFDDIIDSIEKTVTKYRIEIMGIAHALSGAPSTPWHVTIGNPLRPIFCSGDMHISGDVTVKLGSVLAFNDLPSSIKVDFTLQNSRPLGLQEILAKFNAGSLRTVNIKKDFTDIDSGIETAPYFDNPLYDSSGGEIVGSQSGGGTSSNTGGNSTEVTVDTKPSTSTKDNNLQQPVSL